MTETDSHSVVTGRCPSILLLVLDHRMAGASGCLTGWACLVLTRVVVVVVVQVASQRRRCTGR